MTPHWKAIKILQKLWDKCEEDEDNMSELKHYIPGYGNALNDVARALGLAFYLDKETGKTVCEIDRNSR